MKYHFPIHRLHRKILLELEFMKGDIRHASGRH